MARASVTLRNTTTAPSSRPPSMMGLAEYCTGTASPFLCHSTSSSTVTPSPRSRVREMGHSASG